jgi:branched-chain amino acid transport system permease protein
MTMSMPALRTVIILVVVLATALAAPQVLTSAVAQNLAILSILYAVVASNWDLTLGYAGIFNFAHVAFFGIGSYVAAISTLQFGVPIWWDLCLAVVVVMAVGGLVSALALRLRGIYVALVTFALTQLCVALINSQKDLTGGPIGLIGVPDLQIGGFDFSSDARSYFYAAELLLIVSTLALRRLVRSSFGLSLIALRDNEDYAVSRGIPARRQRVLAIVASSISTSLAGCLYAHYLIVASPDVFSFSLTTLLLSMVLVGGAGTIYGPIVAAIALTVGTEELATLGNLRYMIVAVLIVLTLRFLPGGIWSLWRVVVSTRRETLKPSTSRSAPAAIELREQSR